MTDTDRATESGINVLVAVLGMVDQPKAVTIIKQSEQLIKSTVSAIATGDPKPAEMTSVIATTVSTMLVSNGEEKASQIIMMLVPVLQMIIGDFVQARIEGTSIEGEIDFTKK